MGQAGTDGTACPGFLWGVGTDCFFRLVWVHKKAWKMKRLFPAGGWMVPRTAMCGAHGCFLGNTLCLMNISPVPQEFRERSSLRLCGAEALFPGWRVLGVKRFRFRHFIEPGEYDYAFTPQPDAAAIRCVLLSGERRMAEGTLLVAAAPARREA